MKYKIGIWNCCCIMSSTSALFEFIFSLERAWCVLNILRSITPQRVSQERSMVKYPSASVIKANFVWISWLLEWNMLFCESTPKNSFVKISLSERIGVFYMNKSELFEEFCSGKCYHKILKHKPFICFGNLRNFWIANLPLCCFNKNYAN